MLNPQEQKRFCALRREVIERDFHRLNPEQRTAVLATEGPLLLLAGAGSGKTTVLINRVANLMKYGRGADTDEVSDLVEPDDLAFLEAYATAPAPEGRARAERLCRVDPAPPWSILAITFTNKAAGELKERLARMLGPGANDVWASTFHSCCARILRRDIDKLGYATSFTIYDTADSERVVKDIIKERNIDDKAFPPKTVLGYISRAKDALKLAGDYAEECQKTGDYRLQRIASIYTEYEKKLKAANALDFDDLILQTVLLLQKHEDVRNYYQRKFRYVLVDEYQDTNNLQYQLASILAGGHENFCVVGDDDQSIYRFRGATIENILSFEAQYPACRTIRLEQNYRSTQNILEAANSVIRNNQGRKGKELWTSRGAGDKLQLYTAMNQDEEAHYVATQILEGYSQGRHWKDFAILYRTNAQSRELEMAMKRNGIPYRIFGGTRFFDRSEVKDMLAYLCVINNPGDDLRLQRIINNPPRGIGATTVERAQQIAVTEGRSLWEVVSRAGEYPELQKAASKLNAFTEMIRALRKQVGEMALTDFYDALCADSGYAIALEVSEKVEDQTRLENVRELKSSIQSYLNNAEEATLAGFLDEISLYTDIDAHDPSEECVVMMTMHSAKGLEFPVVFAVGMEEGIFPGIRSIGDMEEMEEERRLCYVAMTRAKERLYLTCANQRMLYGHTSANRASRFLGEIPDERVERSGRPPMSELWKNSQWSIEREDDLLDDGDYYDDDRPSSGWGQPYGGYGGQSGSGYGGYGGYGGGSRPKPAYGGYSASPKPKASRPVRPVARKAPPLPDFRKGEMVMHKAFGKGMILSLTPMGGDALVEIAFDNVGTKKLMLRSAAQYMEKLS